MIRTATVLAAVLTAFVVQAAPAAACTQLLQWKYCL